MEFTQFRNALAFYTARDNSPFRTACVSSLREERSFVGMGSGAPAKEEGTLTNRRALPVLTINSSSVVSAHRQRLSGVVR